MVVPGRSQSLQHDEPEMKDAKHAFRNHSIDDSQAVSSISLSSTTYQNLIQQQPLMSDQRDSGDFKLSDETVFQTTIKSRPRLGQDRSLCWRLDPSQSLSDWELQVFNRSSKSFDTYNVHKVVLAIGPRGCGYFQDAFQLHKETTAYRSKVTRVPLIAQACALMPDFLDYVYGKEDFEITKQNVVGLCHLAEFFKNQTLWEEVMEFIHEDLRSSCCRKNLQMYYVECVYYDQHELLAKVLVACARELLHMVEEGVSYTDLLDEMSPAHFSQILLEYGEDEESSTSIFLTRLITKYCSLHQSELSMEMFEDFTSRVTVLDSSSALTLLEGSLEYDFTPYKTRNESLDSVSSLIFFQRECIGTLSEEWEHLLDLDQERITRIMRTLSLREEHQTVLVDWFQKTLIRASNQLAATRKEKNTIQQEHDELKRQYQMLEEDLEFAHSKYAALHRNYTTTKSEMKTQISAWVRKSEGLSFEKMADEEQWRYDRSRWEMERLKWENEKYEMNRQMNMLRDELRAARQPERGVANKRILSYADDSYSVATEASTNSLVQDEVNGYDQIYSMTNGMSPQFRLF